MKRIALLAALAAALTLPSAAVAADGWSWPVRGDVITPYRNGGDPYAAGQHRGIDIAAPVGTRVQAAAAGRVTFVGTAGSSGLTVGVRTADGRYDVSYLHLSAAAVREGDALAGGDAIGAVGTSGRRSAERPHLHLGVRAAGERHAYRDPLELLPPLLPPGPERPAVPVVAATPDAVAAPPAVAPALLPVAVAAAGALVPEGAGAAPPAAPAAMVGAPGVTGAQPAGGSTAPRGGDASRAPALAGRPRPARRGARVTATDVAAPATRDRPAERVTSRHPHTARAPERRTSPPAPSAGPPGVAGTTRSPVHEIPRRSAARPTAPAAIDAGWLAAVVGLIAAALCLGRPDTAQRAARQSRATLAALLRPLTGRV